MRIHEQRIDVTAAAGLSAPLETAATVYLPDDLTGPAIVVFAFPGGGYTRRYYDIAHDGGAYSQAAHHVGQGLVFVACDHVGIGGSSPVDPFDLRPEMMAAANHAAVTTLVERLRSGGIAEGLGPVTVARIVGIGQSMGGCLLVVQQGRHATFDAVGVLGYSVMGPAFPMPDGRVVKYPPVPRDAELRALAAARSQGGPGGQADMLRYSFHAADEDPALVEADLRGGSDAPWRAGHAPPCAAMMMGDGVVAAEAAAIRVPVLLAFGAIDLIGEARAEPLAYTGAADIMLLMVERMAHMHNFARTRTVLWDRIALFARTAVVA